LYAFFENNSASRRSCGETSKLLLTQNHGCELRPSADAIPQKGAVMKEVAVIRNFAVLALLLAFLIILPAARAD
jgi:hypothetical protein